MVLVLLKKLTYLCNMFIRQVKKQNTKQGKIFYQYQLVQASRIDGVVKQRQVLYLGSELELNDKQISSSSVRIRKA
jgi:hypothetical protein